MSTVFSLTVHLKEIQNIKAFTVSTFHLTGAAQNQQRVYDEDNEK